ncbi:MAG: class I SAM-dependent methyltransferase [Mycobacteriales bacterium]
MGDGLLDDAALAASAVVANCAMNRERQLTGVNSYRKELGFDPSGVVAAGGGWLDLCCGTGRALIQAAERLRGRGVAVAPASLVGVDLVPAFDPVPEPLPGLELVCAPVTGWAPDRRFDLVTCVHGLHYVGDKLGVLARAAGWLTGGGRFVADLDLDSVRLADGRPAGRRLVSLLRAAGFRYDPRRRRIDRTGPGEVDLPYAYLGADPRAGPNYTGQPAVRSYYRESP